MNERFSEWAIDTVKLAVFIADARSITREDAKDQLLQIVNSHPGLIDATGIECGRRFMAAVLGWCQEYLAGDVGRIHAGKAVRALPRPGQEFVDVAASGQ